MSSPSGYTIVADAENTFAINVPFFPSDITFSGTPGNLAREIQVDITTSSAVNLEMTQNGAVDWVPINNAQTLFGKATFTFLVQPNAEVNFRNTTGSVDIDIVVAA